MSLFRAFTNEMELRRRRDAARPPPARGWRFRVNGKCSKRRDLPAVLAVIVMMSATFLLSACGFEPLHGAKISAIGRPGIEIGNIPDFEGQFLRNRLIDLLDTNGFPQDAHYQLKISPLVKDIVNIGIQKDATATRAQMQIATTMQLVEKSTGKILLQRDLKTVGAYNLLDNQLATMTSQRSVTENILQELGDDIVMELDLYFRRTKAS